MKKSEKKAIINKAVELGFLTEMPIANIFVYKLPLGLNTELWLDISIEIPDISLFNGRTYIPIRKVESPEDLKLLFDAICPEKFRLPFD